MAIDPSFALSGAEWKVGPVEPVQPTGGDGAGFGDMLGGAMRSLGETQAQAAQASQALAAGQASDPTAVVMAVERAQLAMQLAGQLRTKGVEAIQDIFHTQV
jgi:flagellar hook-basal body complex protein FliE